MMEELGVIQDTLTMHDFYIIDTKVEEVARALGLLDLGLSHDVTDLSGGQRMKVLLAKLLLEKPDILLLDEPTNHLDAEMAEWLENYLKNYRGAIPLILDYKIHDYSTAAISHLPHMIAYSLVNLVRQIDDDKETMKTIAAGGFKDITRIASSSPVMWQNICASNREPLLSLMDQYLALLTQLRGDRKSVV